MSSSTTAEEPIAGEPAGDDRDRAAVRQLADLLDTRFRIPGTNWRFGVDGILGLVPGVGDAAGLVLSSSVILQAVRLGARGATVVRMVGNVAVDTAVGAIPILGSIFDFAFKANTRNVRLLERHVVDAEGTRARSATAVRGTIIGAVVALLLIVGAVVAGVIWLVSALF